MGVNVTADGKILKITCITALFAGIASLVLGGVLLVANNVDIDAMITAGEGLISSVYGVRTSILANVPSNTSKIKNKALLLTLVGAAVLAAFRLAGFDVTIQQTVLAICVAVIALAGFIMASRIVKEQLRK